MSYVMGKPAFCICGDLTADQHAFVFATLIVQFLCFLNTNFQASSPFSEETEILIYSILCFIQISVLTGINSFISVSIFVH